MNSRRQSLFPDNFMKKLCQSLALRMTQCGTKRLLMLAPDESDLVQHLPSVLRKMKCMLTPIIHIRVSLNESATFQLVQNGDQAAGMNP